MAGRHIPPTTLSLIVRAITEWNVSNLETVGEICPNIVVSRNENKHFGLDN